MLPAEQHYRAKKSTLTAQERVAARDRWYRVFDAGKRLLIMRHVLRPVVRQYSALESIKASQVVTQRTEEVLVLPEPAARLSWRERIWITLDDPESSNWARAWSLFILFAILWSCIAFVVQSLPAYVNSTASFWDVQEEVCIIIFAAEYLLRFATSPAKVAFLFSCVFGVLIIECARSEHLARDTRA